MARYALRFETEDGTLEEPFHYMVRKDNAIRAAKLAARDTACLDIVRVHVDDTRTDLGVFVAPVKKE